MMAVSVQPCQHFSLMESPQFGLVQDDVDHEPESKSEPKPKPNMML